MMQLKEEGKIIRPLSFINKRVNLKTESPKIISVNKSLNINKYQESPSLYYNDILIENDLKRKSISKEKKSQLIYRNILEKQIQEISDAAFWIDDHISYNLPSNQTDAAKKKFTALPNTSLNIQFFSFCFFKFTGPNLPSPLKLSSKEHRKRKAVQRKEFADSISKDAQL